jgi:hypothetical protein
MDNIPGVIHSHDILKSLLSENIFQKRGDWLAAYIDFIVLASPDGRLEVSSAKMKYIWERWGLTHKMTYKLFTDLIENKLLTVVSKKSRNGVWVLIIPEIYRGKKISEVGINKTQPLPRSASNMNGGVYNTEQSGGKPGGYSKSQKPSKSRTTPKVELIVNEEPPARPPSSPQKLVDEFLVLFTGLPTDLSPTKVLKEGGSKRGGVFFGENNLPTEIDGTEVEDLQQPKIKNKKSKYEFVHPETGQTRFLMHPPQEYQFIGKKINILYRDYMENFVQVYPYFERGDQMMQFIKWFDDQLTKRPEDKQKNWWNELHAILKKKNMAAFSDHG